MLVAAARLAALNLHCFPARRRTHAKVKASRAHVGGGTSSNTWLVCRWVVHMFGPVRPPIRQQERAPMFREYALAVLPAATALMETKRSLVW